MSRQVPDHAKKMQRIGLAVLTVLFGAWFYYQSRSASELEEHTAGDQAASQSRVSGAQGQDKALGMAEVPLQLATMVVDSIDPVDSVDSGAKENGKDGSPSLSPATLSSTPVIVETDVYRATLNPLGGVMTSLILKRHLNNGQPLEMVWSAGSERYPFTFYLGDYRNGQAVLLPSRVEQIGELAYRFTTEFTAGESDDVLVLEKTLEFVRSEYMVKVGVRLQYRSSAVLPQNSRQVIYSLYYGPQIGPEVDHIGRNRTATDMRTYVYYDGRKSKTISLNRNSRDKYLDSSPIWAGVSGKYLGVFGLPSRNLDVYWSGADVAGLGLDATGSRLPSSQFLFERRSARAGDRGDNLVDDSFYYYIGPLIADELAVFNKSSDNEFGLSDAGLNTMVKFRLGFIEEPVRWILSFLNSFTHNYGVAIIIFALIIRLLLFPLTLKSYKSMCRMRLLQPKIKELQDKHKDDPRKLQQEMSMLYRTEKVNPIGGCLPIVLQMPILIAIANLFYRYFELRGASFIPGWIGDLSSPDLVYSLTLGSWSIPLRLLPPIYLASQLLSSKLMQASQPPTQNKMQQRIFTVFMPVVFSFILYNMPSGLLLYWTISNILMTVQQLLMNKYSGDDAIAVKHEADALIARKNRAYVAHQSKRGKMEIVADKDRGQGPNKKASQSVGKGSNVEKGKLSR